MTTPLHGVRVVDLSRLLPGACCTLALADLGAEVVKVEDPRGGDLLRTIPPFVAGTSVYHHALNRNKRSVTLDLRAPGAAAILDRLIERADVFVESFRPHTARRLGVSADALLARHPRLVHCSLTGFGQSGAHADRAAHDLNFVALSGLFEVDQPGAFGSAPRLPDPRSPIPTRSFEVPSLLVADIGGAWAAVAGITTALFQRERTGRGSAVDISIHDVAVSWLTFPAAARMIGAESGESAPPFPITSDEACYGIYTTADGRPIALAAIERKFWQRFCERAGCLDVVNMQFVPGVQATLRQRLAQVFASRTRAQWLDVFADTDVCLTPVNTIREALRDPHLLDRGSILEHEGSKYIRTPIVIRQASGRASVPIAPAVPLGADTDMVLREAGIDESMIGSLRQSGAI